MSRISQSCHMATYILVLVYYSKTVGITSRTSKRHKVIIIEEKTAKALL